MGCATSRSSTPSPEPPRSTRNVYEPRNLNSSSSSLPPAQLVNLPRHRCISPAQDINGFAGITRSHNQQSATWSRSHTAQQNQQQQQTSRKPFPTDEALTQDINGFNGIYEEHGHPNSSHKYAGNGLRPQTWQRNQYQVPRKPLTRPALGIDTGQRRAGASFSDRNSNILSPMGYGDARSYSPVSPVDTKKWDR